MTVLYATHILTELFSVADRMAVLRHGKIVYDSVLKEDGETPEKIFIRLYNEEISGKKK